MSATLEAVSNRVGKSSFCMWEFMEGVFLSPFDRCRHTQSLSGVPGCWIWTETRRGEQKMGPRRIFSTCWSEKGPDIRPARSSSVRYLLTVSGKRSVEEWFLKITVSVSGGMSPKGKPYLRF